MALWDELQQGEAAALSGIFEQYHTSLLKYGMVLTQNKELVKDSIQELFLYLWQQREQLSQIHAISYYLIVSLRRIVIRKLQQERRTGNRLHAIAAGREGLFEKPVQDAIISDERAARQRQALKQAINALPRRQREAIFLRFYQELDYASIATIMHLNYQGVRNLIYRSVKALRKQLNTEVLLLPLLCLLAEWI
jgi:RNA polymerase sigma factor (sigma-70 family)